MFYTVQSIMVIMQFKLHKNAESEAERVSSFILHIRREVLSGKEIFTEKKSELIFKIY